MELMPTEMPMHNPKKILIIRPDAIGDMALTMPAIQAIKECYPDSHITVWAAKLNAQLIDDVPWVNALIYSPPLNTFKEWRTAIGWLRSFQFDVAVHFYCEAKPVWLTYFARIPMIIGDKAKLGLWWPLRKHGLFYKSFDQPKHVVEYNFLLLKPLGIVLDQKRKYPYTAPPAAIEAAENILSAAGRNPNKPLIGIHLGVGFGNRPIRPEKYADYITSLKQVCDVDIILTGNSDRERKFRDILISKIQTPVMDLVGKLTLKQLMGIISKCIVYVSVDTGPFHLASALNIPQLALFPSKKVKPLSWGPWRNPHLMIRHARECAYDCPHENCPYDICSDAIPVSEMVEKTQRLLNGEGITGAQAQFEYWFEYSMTILILYDRATEPAARTYSAQLKSWGLDAVSAELTDPLLFQIILKNDVSIIHNLTFRRKLYLFWLSQRATAKLHNPPLIVNQFLNPDNKSDTIEYYRREFEKKWL